MDEVTKLFNRYCSVWEQDIRGSQIGCYSIAIIGLTVALRKVRPFSKFKRPQDVPQRFIDERRELVGYVNRVEPGGGILMVKHKPLVDLPVVKDGELPVKISGVKVSGLGVNWLQAIVVDNEIKFIPVYKDKKFLHCEVMLPQTVKPNKTTNLLVGETLLKIGFGTVEQIEKPLPDAGIYLPYYNRLKTAEKYALKKKMGYKYYVKPTVALVKLTHAKISDLVLSASKQVPKLYKVVSS